MESLNIVVLSGLISKNPDTEGDGCTFPIKTFRIDKTGGKKQRIAEYHEVEMRNPGTILRYLRIGKSIIVKGRLGSNGVVIAESVTFPALKDTNE